MFPKLRVSLSVSFSFAILCSILFSLAFYNDDRHLTSIVMILGNALALVFILVTAVQQRRARRRELDTEAEKNQFSLLVKNSGDLIAIADLDRAVRYINDAGREMVGLSKEIPTESLRGSHFYSDEYNERMRTEVFPSVLERGFWSGEFAYQDFKTKALIPVLMNLFPLKDPKSEKVLGFAVVSRDIRDRKKLERQLERFFEVSLDMLGIANVSGYFLKLNPAFTEILGYSEAELCSRPCTDFIHPDDIASTIEQLEAQAGGSPVKSFENRYRTKSGDYRWFSWKSSPDGELTYGAARDVTEEKKQALRMQELSQQAIAASQAKSEFLANMSHEIRTPINGVIGMTNLLLDSGLSPQQLEYAESIQQSADSLLTVINDILDFSKIEAGKLSLEEIDFSLEELIDETAKNLSWAVRNKSLPFVVSCERGSKYLYRGDPGRIRQILNNLLSNAIKFTETGSIRLEARAIHSTANQSTFRFSVVDSGIGLSEENLNKLFHAFSQADASTARKFGGTGLGLSISKKLVELMGGEIGATSAEGEGSEFWFSLTLAHSASRVEIAKVALSDLKTRFVDARILVADDNFVNQKILLAMLTKIGFRAQAVGNGNEALALLHEQTFDLILMDCQMPDLDGYETTRRIRRSETVSNPNLPIIALTANALKGDRERCLEAGMNDYASKPIPMDKLLIIIEKWLDTVTLQKNS